MEFKFKNPLCACENEFAVELDLILICKLLYE